MNIKWKEFPRKAKRGPQVILPKDAAIIAAYTSLESGNKVVDAGTGSGWLAAYLAKIVAPKGELITYEHRPEFAKLAKKNFKRFGIKNIKLKEKDIYKGICEKNLDLITLDLQKPWKVISHAEKALKENSYVVVYSPQITQALEFVNALEDSKLKFEKTIEILERKWKIKGKVARPEHRMLGHTGFLTFVRKLTK
ncbi:methyltransferase domain-containing protein [Candidatus Woesearchaeota archaeon]|nr:methyltransferase domain-containing protein [Candidatus Woesearchaeota archaeon]